MSARLTIGYAGQPTELMRALAASLPRSLHPVSDGIPDVLVISGEAGWASRALEGIEAGARRLVVIEPGREVIASIRLLAGRAMAVDAKLALSEGLACDPAVPVIREWFANGADVLAFRGRTVDEPIDQMFRQVRVARALGVQDFCIEGAIASHGGLLAAGSGAIGGQRVGLQFNAVLHPSHPSPLIVDIAASECFGRIVLFGGHNARPAHCRLETSTGSTLPPAVFEAAHRAVLRKLVGGGWAGTSDALVNFADDLDRVSSAHLESPGS